LHSNLAKVGRGQYSVFHGGERLKRYK